MKQDYKYMFNEQEFVAVWRKSDYENDNIGDGIFLVYKNEWEDTDDYSIKTFDLLLTSIEGNTIKLYPTPNNAVIIVQQLPYSRKSEYMEIPKEYTFDTSFWHQFTHVTTEIRVKVLIINLIFLTLQHQIKSSGNKKHQILSIFQ